MLQESIDSLVNCLSTPLEAICSKFGKPSLKLAFVKSSATTLAWGMIPSEMVVIEPASVFGTDWWETGALWTFCLLWDCQHSPLARHHQSSQLYLVVLTNEFSGRPAVCCCPCRALRVSWTALVSPTGAKVGMPDPEASGEGMSFPPPAESILSNSHPKSHWMEWSLEVVDPFHASVEFLLHHPLAL